MNREYADQILDKPAFTWDWPKLALFQPVGRNIPSDCARNLRQFQMRHLIHEASIGRHCLLDKARTMAATGEYVGKYGIQAEQNYNESTIDELLRNAGVTDPTQRLAVKLEMQRAGQLVR